MILYYKIECISYEKMSKTYVKCVSELCESGPGSFYHRIKRIKAKVNQDLHCMATYTKMSLDVMVNTCIHIYHKSLQHPNAGRSIQQLY